MLAAIHRRTARRRRRFTPPTTSISVTPGTRLEASFRPHDARPSPRQIPPRADASDSVPLVDALAPCPPSIQVIGGHRQSWRGGTSPQPSTIASPSRMMDGGLWILARSGFSPGVSPRACLTGFSPIVVIADIAARGSHSDCNSGSSTYARSLARPRRRRLSIANVHDVSIGHILVPASTLAVTLSLTFPAGLSTLIALRPSHPRAFSPAFSRCCPWAGTTTLRARPLSLVCWLCIYVCVCVCVCVCFWLCARLPLASSAY
ncbi:hypothetical protein GY45DRAFT_207833 [Cubamyces sp. BRFM 1775]|nr:hypothetical protein GY45DRAFT_207833 [Cubamyces sp. BRFM 1775]